jgi:hypothetical protein
MLHRPGTGRPGISLLEVLTAIFIMGIGMLALLTLFPLGALSMARAIRDERAAAMAGNAASIATMFNLRKDKAVDFAFDTDPTHNDPNATPPPATVQRKNSPADPNEPSAPVLIDPLGALLVGQRNLGEYPYGTWSYATPGSPGIVRVIPGFLTNQQMANYWFTLQDEIEFDTFGAPLSRTSAGFTNYVNRPGTYSYACLVRRPRQGSRELTELTVIVYSQRVIDVIDPEPTYFDNTGMWKANTPRNQILVPYPPAGDKPPIRKGTWLIDVSFVAPNPLPPATATTGNTVNGFVYRAENVTETATGLMVDLDREIKANISTLAVLKNAIAVVERGTTWAP